MRLAIFAATPVLWTIEYAHGLNDADLAGWPAWVESFDDAYDITGKAERAVSDAECRAMVQSLFEDRFQLKLHHEMCERPAYLLTVAKNGPKVQEVRPDSPDLGGVRFNGRHPAILSEDTPPKGWSMARLARHLADVLDALRDQLGLLLEAGRASVDTVMIDRVARPSGN